MMKYFWHHFDIILTSFWHHFDTFYLVRNSDAAEKKKDPFRKICKSLFYYSIDLFTLSLPQKKKGWYVD